MAKKGFLKKDSFAALLITLIFTLAIIFDAPVLRNLENAAYDAGVRMTNRHVGAAEEIVIIAIDDASINQIGRWPWSRHLLADMIASLSQAHAKVVSLQIFLSEAQSDPGLVHIRKLHDYVNTSRLPKVAPKESQEMSTLLTEAEQDLDADVHLAQVLPHAKNTLMPMFFRRGVPLGRPDAALPEFVQRNRLLQVIVPAHNLGMPPSALSVIHPLEAFGVSTAGIGHLNLIPDEDGAIRADPLVFEYYGDYYPSLALLVAAKSLNLDMKDISIVLGDSVRLGKLSIKTDENMRMYSGFYRDPGKGNFFPTYAFAGVRSGKVPLPTFNNKIVLIGATASGIGDTQVTPVAKDMSGPEVTANMVASILNQDFYHRPQWAVWAEVGVYVAVLIYLMFALTAMSAGPAAFVSFAFFLTLLGGGHYLLVSKQLWLQMVSPALLLLVGHLLLTTKRFFVTEHQKTRVETDSAQTNRLLGLSFQGQGQLDMALDKFRSLPVDDSVLDLIYNLAMDFERKRQFNKAEAAYDYIRQHNSKFRDVAKRRKRAQQANDTVIIGGAHASPGGTLILSGSDQKPTLGRYEVEKELGKGAMGAVYLGRDPKINRVVAIKTMALAQEFADDELKDVKSRFFREAETAGRLNHPNIVTIYDAGEEHDLAYIAMEYLQGKDLSLYTRPANLLPVDQVADIVGKVADALAYAHRHEVVHRDIKPANIMYDPEKGNIKVTDFGIARITASSRTKTGLILGTPSYMSPEQLAGKHVDGRSDLFSLGVMLYELLTGHQPFLGDSMTTLMYQIANERHQDITILRPDLPECIKTLIDKALHKNPDERFQAGDEFSRAVHGCLGGAMKIDVGAA